IETTFLSE
ncbi:putative exported domain protein, partial [Chlamydia psittaci 03DC29]